MKYNKITRRNSLILHIMEKVGEDSVCATLGFDKKEIETFYELLTGELNGLKELDSEKVKELYVLGFTFEEIGLLRNVTKMGISLLLNKKYKKEELSKFKYYHRKNRKFRQSLIFQEMLETELKGMSDEEICLYLGYTENYYNTFKNKQKDVTKLGCIYYDG